MVNDVVLLFAGQGAQQTGMGADLIDSHPLARRRFEEASTILGFDLSRVMFEGPMHELTRTSRCQPALYVHGIVCWELLQERLPNSRPVAVPDSLWESSPPMQSQGTLRLCDRAPARRQAWRPHGGGYQCNSWLYGRDGRWRRR